MLRRVCVFVLTLLFAGCGADSQIKAAKDIPSPAGYELGKPIIKRLPSKMDEVSGIAYYPPDHALFAIIDEAGMLYKVPLNDKKIEQWEFAEKDDYEDIVLVDSTFFVITSRGRLLSFTFLGNKPSKVENFDLNLTGKNDIETLYHQSDDNTLRIICKDCDGDKGLTNTTFQFSMGEKKFSGASKLNLNQVSDKIARENNKFKPSAAAIHPITGELFIISSVNKTLVVADKNLNPKELYSLDAELYKQPEAIAFAPNGDMFIANESADEGSANILVFKYKSAK